MTVLLAFGMTSVTDLAIVPLLAGLALVIVLLTGQGRTVLRRLRGPALLASGFLLVLPFASGQTAVASIGALTLRAEGLEAGVLIAARLLSIVAVTLALLAPVPPFRLVGAMRALGVPILMADLALLTLRYLEEIRADIARARVARKLRGGGAGWRALRDYGMLIAAALIRGHQRADRLWAAMRLRGYHAGLAAPLGPLQAHDRWAIALAALAALALFWFGRGQ